MRDDGWWWFMPLAGQFDWRKQEAEGDGTVNIEELGPIRKFIYRMGLVPLPDRITPEYWVNKGYYTALWKIGCIPDPNEKRRGGGDDDDDDDEEDARL